jgi:nucleoside-diphosphate-sugar epimerase
MTRVLVAGATGVIGRRLVPQLLAAGHEVVGLTSREAGRGEIESLGAQAAVADALDPAATRAALEAARPEAVIHQLTRIPAQLNPRRVRQDFALNDQLRTEGTRNLLDAALAAGATRFVAQSVAFFYAPADVSEATPLDTEDDPLWLDAPPVAERTVGAIASLERQVLSAAGLEGTVLRYGFFYGPDTAYAPEGGLAQMVRKRKLPIIGDGAGRSSFVHVDDAAEATVLALAGPPGLYNVCDDEPAAQRDFLPVYAETLGAPAPRSVPFWLARLVAGPYINGFARQRGAANAKAKLALDWAPAHASWREGFSAQA